MKYYQGRLIDHLHLHVADLARSRRFYEAILSALDSDAGFGGDEECFYCDELFVDAAGPASTNVHLAFQAHSTSAVQAFYSAGLAAGGSDNGAPGMRSYHKHYYAAFLKDPDGNNVEAVCDMAATRSAAGITVTRSD